VPPKRRSRSWLSTRVLRLRRAAFKVVFIEDALQNHIRRPMEPAFGLRFALAEGPAQLGRVAAHFHAVDADGDDGARSDVRASPHPARTPERPAEGKVCMLMETILRMIKDIIMREVARIAVRCNGIYISLMSGSF
jgi:hypothetical protein